MTNHTHNKTYFKAEGIGWHWSPAVAAVAGEIQEAVENPESIQLIKQNKRRAVYRTTNSSASLSLYVKHDHPQHFRDKIKSLWRCKAQREYAAGQALAAAGVPAVDPLGWGTKGTDSFLVTRELPNAIPMEEAWNSCRQNSSKRAVFLEGLLNFLASLMQANVYHPDLHMGNILTSVNPDKVKFYLVDMYGVKIKKALSQSNEKNILRLPIAILRSLGIKEAEKFYKQLQPYCNHAEICSNPRRLLEKYYGDANKKWPRRAWRYLQASCFCTTQSTPSGRWILLKPMDIQTAEQAVSAHKNNVTNNRNIIKNGGKRIISRVTAGDRSYVVKQFTGQRWRGPWRTDRQAWLNHHHLRKLNIPACHCHAWLQSSTPGEGFLILKDLGDHSLRHLLFLQNADMETLRHLLYETASLVAWLHLSGVDHCDLKVSNFMPPANTKKSNSYLRLIDIDRVHFYHRMPPRKRRLRNIDQIFGALSYRFPAAYGLRFLAKYRQIAGKKAFDNQAARDKVKKHWPAGKTNPPGTV